MAEDLADIEVLNSAIASHMTNCEDAATNDPGRTFLGGTVAELSPLQASPTATLVALDPSEDKAATPDVVSTQKPPPKTFFDLPPEVRNTIYECALREDSAILPGTGKEPALFITCRQAREEALQMFYSVNDLELYLWPSQIHYAQAPVYRWSYYHVGANTLPVGQCITVRSQEFTICLEQADVKGTLGLVLKELRFHSKDGVCVTDMKKRHAVDDALDYVFRNKDKEMVSWLGHNVVRGLVLWAHAYLHRKVDTPLECIGGSCVFDERRGGDVFFAGW
ncbi:hypothetical protein LTR08_007723 [Meristemomyces frigidus]|nr:hypothetical protein LTR08_007723 [Meristemomyces frigidus]